MPLGAPVRSDAERAFERRLLGSAPPNVLGMNDLQIWPLSEKSSRC